MKLLIRVVISIAVLSMFLSFLPEILQAMVETVGIFVGPIIGLAVTVILIRFLLRRRRQNQSITIHHIHHP